MISNHLAGARFGIAVPVLVLLAGTRAASARAPEGYLDAAGPSMVGGWARDPDWSGRIPVHVYIDGVLHRALVAGGSRPDVPCDCGYSWVPPPLGPGAHSVVAYGIGVDSTGAPDGENVGLTRSPMTFAGNCDGLSGSAFVWCRDNPGYWSHRPGDTVYLSNDDVRFGVNRSYGGTILELYGADWNDNVILEHGGGAMQLSLWGYDPVGDAAYFRDGICDPTPYSACPAGWAPGCMYLCCSGGAHVANCGSVGSCAFTAGAPYNPIQAQGSDCGWENAGNDVTALGINPDPPWIHVVKDDPQQFTKTNAFPGLTWEQVAKILPAGIQVDYHISYAGPRTLGAHNQELPALFPAAGMNAIYHFYSGDAPFTGGPVTSAVAPAGPADQANIRLPGREFSPALETVIGEADENWVTACNAGESKCITVAGFSPEVRWFAVNGTGRDPYLTPTGRFDIRPGLDLRFTVYVFPYRFDRTVAGKTIRRHVHDFAASAGCLAYGSACDDGNRCTEGDVCDGGGGCRGTPIGDDDSREACDGIDNDCDGATDEPCGADADGGDPDVADDVVPDAADDAPGDAAGSDGHPDLPDGLGLDVPAWEDGARPLDDNGHPGSGDGGGCGCTAAGGPGVRPASLIALAALALGLRRRPSAGPGRLGRRTARGGSCSGRLPSCRPSPPASARTGCPSARSIAASGGVPSDRDAPGRAREPVGHAAEAFSAPAHHLRQVRARAAAENPIAVAEPARVVLVEALRDARVGAVVGAKRIPPGRADAERVASCAQGPMLEAAVLHATNDVRVLARLGARVGAHGRADLAAPGPAGGGLDAFLGIRAAAGAREFVPPAGTVARP